MLYICESYAAAKHMVIITEARDFVCTLLNGVHNVSLSISIYGILRCFELLSMHQLYFLIKSYVTYHPLPIGLLCFDIRTCRMLFIPNRANSMYL